MSDRLAQTSRPIYDLLARRWSPRAFDANRPVSREQLTALLEAGRWAPSCNGDEPWRYLIWDRKRDPEEPVGLPETELCHPCAPFSYLFAWA